MYKEIVITVVEDRFDKIAFIDNDGLYEYVGPFEPKYHNEFLNLDITVFKFLLPEYDGYLIIHM